MVVGQRQRDAVVPLVVADEVQHDQEILVPVEPQAPPQLLDVHDRRLGGTEHHHLVHRRDVHALVEQVGGEDVVQTVVAVIRFESLDQSLHMARIHLSGYPCGAESPAVEQRRQLLRLLESPAEHQPLQPAPAVSVVGGLPDDVVDPLLQFDVAEDRLVVHLDPIDLQLGHAEVVERADEAVFQRLFQTDLVGDVVVEQGVDVVPVGPVRGGGHAEHEPRLEMGYDPLI